MVDRGAIDDGGAIFHMGKRVLGQVKEGVYVGVKGSLPLGSDPALAKVDTSATANSLVDLTDIAQHILESRIVHKNVDAAHLLQRDVNNLLAILLLA